MAAIAVLKAFGPLLLSMLLFFAIVQGQAPDSGPQNNGNGAPAMSGGNGNSTAGANSYSAAKSNPETSQGGSNMTSSGGVQADSSPDTSSDPVPPKAERAATTQDESASQVNQTVADAQARDGNQQNTNSSSPSLTSLENQNAPSASNGSDVLDASTVAMTTPEMTTVAPSDLCEGNPCQNGASCHGNGTNYVCNCTPGWQGMNCTEDVDECLQSPCLHNGTCTNSDGSFTCACATGTTGEKCETNIDDCASSPCLNNGTCVDGLNSFTCNCTQAWNGTLCNQDVDECSTGNHKCDQYATCKNTDGDYECPCNEGYVARGKLCLFDNPCRGWNPCAHGTCVSKLKSYTCHCEKGWTGVNCTEDIDECKDPTPVCSPEAGTCQNTDGSYTCSCIHGYIGDGIVCTENVMYPYSRDIGYHADDNIFGAYNVTGGFPYFGQIYHRLYISLDGAIFVGQKPTRLPTWPAEEEFPSNVRVIAPFWTDIDTFQGQGALYINVYSHVLPPAENDNTSLAYEIVQRLKHDVNAVGVEDFDPSYVIITTWENVSPFPANLYVGVENITFQAVVATDSKQSVALYNFLPEGNHLVPGNDVRPIVIGYSDGVQPMYAVVANRTYMADRGTNVEKAGRYVFKLGDEVENVNAECLRWHSMDKEDMAMNEADPCPCTMNQAKLDTSFEVNETSSCAMSLFPKNNVTQYCCYEKITGALNMGSPDGGYPLFPGETPDENEDRKLCCNDGNVCHLFYQKRPSDTCEKYNSPSVGVVYGDPHIATLDGSHYTFNGLGEFLMLNLNDGRFILQGRTALDTSLSYNKTALTAIALQGNDTEKVEVRLTQGGSTNVVIHLEGAAEKTLDSMVIDEKVNFVGGVMLKQSAKMLLIQLKMKIGIKVHVRTGALWMEVIVSHAYRGADSSVGLLGVFDGRAENDFKMPNGDALVPAESEKKFLSFGNNWTVGQNESLFTYSLDGLAKSWKDFTYPNFMPTIFFDLLANDANTTATFNLTRMKILCENSTPCLIDFAATGDKDIAQTTKDMQEYVTNNQAILRSTPPRFLNMPHVLEVNMLRMLKLNISMNIKDVKFNINTTSVSKPDISDSTLKWVPLLPNGTELHDLNFKITARNDLGLSAIYWPSLKVCPFCLNRGTCVLNSTMDMMAGEMMPGKAYVSKCLCKTGFEGPTCSEEVDPCSHSPCPRGTTCEATPGIGIGYKCGECPPGFLMRHSKCYDNNECIDGSAMCSQKCENKPGSYSCLCEPGFELQADKHTCKDINECAKMQCGPNQYCTNAIGSYNCRCKASYFMDGGVCRHGPRQFGGQLVFKYVNLTGVGITSWKPDMAKAGGELFYKVTTLVEDQLDAAFRNMDPDNFLATKVFMLQKGSIIAHFNTYFTLGASPSEKSLGDALQSHLNDSGCTARGPDCQVGDLIGLSTTWSYATATNLCLRSQDNNCDSQSTNCTSNGDGTFTCSCRAGFQRWRDLTNICQDIDECSDDITNKCNKTSSVCVNNMGSFQCQCRPGYHKLQGASICTDVCEPNPCKNEGKCLASTKGPSRYTCKCTSTWTGHHCEFEHEESKRLRTAVIIIAAILGSLTLIFFILMIVCWYRARRAKREYNTSEIVDGWAEPTMMIGSNPRNPSLFEMKENGTSQQNLLEQKYGVRGIDDDSTLVGEGVQNPAYTSTFQPPDSNKGKENF